MIVIVIIFTIKSFYLILFNWFHAKFIFNVKHLYPISYSGYIWQPYLFHINRNSSTLIRNIITEVNTFTSCTTSIIILLTEILVFIGISTLLVMYEPIGSIMTILIFCFQGIIFILCLKIACHSGELKDRNLMKKKFNIFRKVLGDKGV